MHQFEAQLSESVELSPHTRVLRLTGCEALRDAQPGQFIMMRGDWGTDPLLPRAFSLLSVGAGGAELLIKGVGKATMLLERARPGEQFQLVGPLGSSFPEPQPERRDWLVAGGVGLAPLLMHAEAAAEAGLCRQVTMFYGGRSERDLVLLDRIRATGIELRLATEDGSRGMRGYVTEALAAEALGDEASPTVMACGPGPMLEAVARVARKRSLGGYLSLEGEMACGIGACLACAVPCKSEPYRYACKHGPVLPLDDLAGPYA